MKRRVDASVVFVFAGIAADEPNVVAFDLNTTILTLKWMKLLKCGLIRAPIVPVMQFSNFCRHIIIRRLQKISCFSWRRDLCFSAANDRLLLGL